MVDLTNITIIIDILVDLFVFILKRLQGLLHPWCRMKIIPYGTEGPAKYNDCLYNSVLGLGIKKRTIGAVSGKVLMYIR